MKGPVMSAVKAGQTGGCHSVAGQTDEGLSVIHEPMNPGVRGAADTKTLSRSTGVR